MQRRDFLKSLLAIGAGFALPAIATQPAAIASPVILDALDDAAIDEIWVRGITLFDVDESRTISFADFVDPMTRSDAYDVCIGDLIDDSGLIDFCDRSTLGRELQYAYEGYRNDLLDQLDEADTASERKNIKHLLSRMPDDPDEGWVLWLEADPASARSLYDPVIEHYLGETPDWGNEYEWLPDTANAQGAAYRFFLSKDMALLDTLGIVIVEGDCPGSSYFAAELTIPVDEANAAAKAADIPYRFTPG